MLALIITALKLVSIILDEITVLEKSKIFVSIKKSLNSILNTAKKHHNKNKKVKKMKPKSNKLVKWLLIIIFLNLCFSGFLFNKVRNQGKQIDTLIVITYEILYNNKDFQNNLKDKNLADSY